ncbi:uncharacterized protein LOC144121154 [Amblyomma americanum]
MLAFESEEGADDCVQLSHQVFSSVEKMCAEGGIFEKLSAAHQLYMTLETSEDDPHIKNFAVVKDNIVEDIRCELTELQAKYKALQEKAADMRHDEIEESSSSDQNELASQRRALHKKTYFSKSSTQKEKRLEQLLEEPGCSDSVEASVPPAAKRAGEKSEPRASASGAGKTGKK